ncbi:MAG: XRE family transcriptional regulator [Bacteroidetes bacterium]|nr:MAG: XRE family transcriptional regulator [Bacteroidota bacterium]
MEELSLSQKIGNKFRLLRTEKGLRQEDMAEKLSISVSAYAKLERGETDITLSRIEKIANLYGLKPTEMINVENKTDFSFNNNSYQNNSNVYQGSFANPVNLSEEINLLKTHIITLDSSLNRLLNRIESLEKKSKKEKTE